MSYRPITSVLSRRLRPPTMLDEKNCYGVHALPTDFISGTIETRTRVAVSYARRSVALGTSLYCLCYALHWLQNSVTYLRISENSMATRRVARHSWTRSAKSPGRGHEDRRCCFAVATRTAYSFTLPREVQTDHPVLRGLMVVWSRRI